MEKKKETTKKATTRKRVAKVKKADDATAITISDAVAMYQKDPSFNEAVATDKLTDEQKEYAETLDSAMEKLPEMELNRVTILATIEPYMEQVGVDSLNKLVGETITYIPYMSTTKKSLREILERRYHNGLSNPVCVVVHTEGKASGIEANKVVGKESKFASSEEIILRRGQKFYVRRIVTDYGWGETYPIIHLYAV